MISPILTYNSEAWGLYTKQDFKTWDRSSIEKVQLQFCKRYLEINNKTSNLACRAELGRFPLILTINQKILNYILYLKSKNDDSIMKQIFLISLDFHSIKETNFYSNLLNMVEYYDLQNFNLDTLDENKIIHYCCEPPGE